MAEATLIPIVIIGIIIGVLFSIAVVSFGMGILNSLTPETIDQASKNNFDSLTGLINSMLESKNDFIFNLKDGGQIFYLRGNVILVGHNYNGNGAYTACTDESATKPAELAKKSGLCLYVDTVQKDFDGDPQEQGPECHSFDEKIIFLAPSDNNYQGGFGGGSKAMNIYGASEQYEDLFLYGSECDIGEPDLGATRLYVEKYKKGEETYIYIDEYNTETKQRLEERYERLSKSLRMQL